MAQTNPNSTSESRQKYQTLLAETRAIQGVSLGKDAWRQLRKNRGAMLGLAILCVVSLVAAMTPLLPLQSPRWQELKTRQLLPPGITRVQLPANPKLPELWTNPGPVTTALIRVRLAVFGGWCLPSLCGTDNLGRDSLARICWGLRVSLLVGLVAASVSLVIGVSWGAIAGYAGGAVDRVMMRIVDILNSIPFIFIVIFLVTVLTEESIKKRLESWGIGQITILYVAIGAFYWLTMARVVRGQVLSLKHEQFVDAARTIGASHLRIIFLHLVPNVLGLVIVYLTLTIPSVMLTEAFLSFLGLGVQAPDVSLGVLVNEGIGVITPVRIYWWLVFFPGLTLAVTLLALNQLGDGLRDALDPRLKNRD